MEQFEPNTRDWLIRRSDDPLAMPSAYTMRELCRIARSLDRELMTPLTLALLGYSDGQIAASMAIDEATVRERIDAARAHFRQIL